MISENKLNSQILLNEIMEDVYARLEKMDIPAYDSIFLHADSATIQRMNSLLEQIHREQCVGNLRSAFRKAMLLRGLLERV